MATITIQIPDELAQRLEPLQNRLPELLWQLLEVTKKSTSFDPEIKTNTADIPAVYQLNAPNRILERQILINQGRYP